MTASTDGPGETTSDGREWSVQRPGRGAYSRLVALAALPPRPWRAFAVCVLARESGATLARPQSGAGARNPASSASGRWQMLDGSGWRAGWAWMVQRRLVRFGMPRAQAVAVRTLLARTPISAWHGTWQDIAAIESLESGGWRHWSGPGCDRLVPR